MADYLSENRKFSLMMIKVFLLTSFFVLHITLPDEKTCGARLMQYVPSWVPKYLIDPEAEPQYFVANLISIKYKATVGVRKFIELVTN
jgi:hypothetical protein